MIVPMASAEQLETVEGQKRESQTPDGKAKEEGLPQPGNAEDTPLPLSRALVFDNG
jgi:hypothetical protein